MEHIIGFLITRGILGYHVSIDVFITLEEWKKGLFSNVTIIRM